MTPAPITATRMSALIGAKASYLTIIIVFKCTLLLKVNTYEKTFNIYLEFNVCGTVFVYFINNIVTIAIYKCVFLITTGRKSHIF